MQSEPPEKDDAVTQLIRNRLDGVRAKLTEARVKEAELVEILAEAAAITERTKPHAE